MPDQDLAICSLQGVGLGLRHTYYPDFLENPQPVDWLEVHAENYFGNGGYDLHVLETLRQQYPLSVHGVGLGIGSAAPLSIAHLKKLKVLCERIDAAAVSEHLCWNAADGVYANELLPLPMRSDLLGWLEGRVSQVQDVLGRPVLLENVSSYVSFKDADLTEAGFLCELARRSGCGVLLDINNLYVNQVNHGISAQSEIDCYLRLPAGQLAEIHLAGHRPHGALLFDTHDAPVSDPVWDLYRYACSAGAAGMPVMIERDAAYPSLTDLLKELVQIRKIRDAHGK